MTSYPPRNCGRWNSVCLDRPEKVVSLCPTCQPRIHHGRDGEEYNEELPEKLADELGEVGASSVSTIGSNASDGRIEIKNGRLVMREALEFANWIVAGQEIRDRRPRRRHYLLLPPGEL